MKKITTLVILGVIFTLTALPVLALDTGINYGTATGLGSKDVREGVMAIVQALMGFLGVVAIIIVLYGGFTWMVAGGNEEKVSQAKKIITAGIIGMVIIFISYAIAQFVIDQLISATI